MVSFPMLIPPIRPSISIHNVELLANGPLPQASERMVMTVPGRSGSPMERNSWLRHFTNLDRSNTPLSLITHPLIVAGDSLWQDLTIEVEFTPLDKFDKCGVVFKYRNPTDYYFFGIEGNTVILKHIQQSVTPLRPIERIVEYRPLIWTPGERIVATITTR